MKPDQTQTAVEVAPDASSVEAFGVWLSQNTWVLFGLAWIVVIIAITELAKRVFDLIAGQDNPKRSAFLQLVPFVAGVATGPILAPPIAETTPFAAIGWIDGLLFGLVAGMGAIGAYELARETRPLRMLKVFIRGAFRFVFG